MKDIMLRGKEARKELLNQVEKSIVAISQEDGSFIGVGFFFSTKPLIFTCAHLIEGLQTCVITRIDNEVEVKENVEVILRDPDFNVAVLEANESPKSFLSLSPSREIQDFGYIFGYDGSNILKMKSGTLLGLRDARRFGEKPKVFVACHAHKGYFGGPMTDSYGRVIGMVLGLKEKSFLSSTRFLPVECFAYYLRHLDVTTTE